MQKVLQITQMLFTSTPLLQCWLKCYKRACYSLGSCALLGSTTDMCRCCLGCFQCRISSSWPGADELLRCGFLKAVENCRWDARHQTCVSPHNWEQAWKILNHVIQYVQCEASWLKRLQYCLCKYFLNQKKKLNNTISLFFVMYLMVMSSFLFLH